MAIDLTALRNSLSSYGNIDFCDINNPNCFVVAMSNVTANESALISIVESYILADYPYLEVVSLIDGVFKCEYDNQPI